MEGLGDTLRCRYGADPYMHTWLWPIPSKGYFNSVVWIITGIRLRPVAVSLTVQLIGIVQTYGVQSDPTLSLIASRHFIQSNNTL
jgi:hypothetical protein